MERHAPTWDEVNDFTRQQSEDDEEEDVITYRARGRGDPLLEMLSDNMRQTKLDEYFHFPSMEHSEYIPEPAEDDAWFVLASTVLSFAGLIGRADFVIVDDNVLYGRAAVHPAVFVAGITRGSFEYSDEAGGIVFDGGVLIGTMADNAKELVGMLDRQQMDDAMRLFDEMYPAD